MSRDSMIFPTLDKSEERMEIAVETIWPLPEGKDRWGWWKKTLPSADADVHGVGTEGGHEN